mgnify:CR=1 FL=1
MTPSDSDGDIEVPVGGPRLMRWTRPFLSTMVLPKRYYPLALSLRIGFSMEMVEHKKLGAKCSDPYTIIESAKSWDGYVRLAKKARG